jgi:hypothetical protein
MIEEGGNTMRISFCTRCLLLVVIMLAIPVASSAGIIFSVEIAPPPLPIYEQPLCPGEGYIWVPGYWAYADDGYFWVPGTWVLAPEPGFLWTPGYWGWGDGVFIFNQGYWALQVGFYGGIDYGFGYTGIGYQGGYWNNGVFFYNRSVNNVTNVTNVYNKTVIVNKTTVNRVSYNGGVGGTTARPTSREEPAARERHIPPTPVQSRHVQEASTKRQLFESVNHGRPAIAATPRPVAFSGRGVVPARAAAPSYKPPAVRSAATARSNRAVPRSENNAARRTGTAVHPNELPPVTRLGPSSMGNPRRDQTYSREQERVLAKQEKERQKLQQKQEQEHQRLARRNANEGARQQLEQKHQQQTHELSQRQAQQMQRLQERQEPATRNPPRSPR